MFLMKESKTKRFSDTAAVHLRRITNPTFTEGDCVVESVARLAFGIRAYARKKKNDANMTDLRQLTDIAEQLTEQSRQSAASPV